MLPIHTVPPGLLSFLVTTFGLTDGSHGDNLNEALYYDFASRIEVLSVESGHFSNVVQKNHLAIHALQVIREDTTSSFILDLLSSGIARACRGWRYLFSNDGPEIHNNEQINEQLGYLGKWSENNGWVEIVLNFEEDECQHFGEYSHLIPNHYAQWQLRCLQLVLKDHPKFHRPILVGQFIGMSKVFGEDHPHLICDDPSNNCWLVLGTGNGIRIKEQSRDDNSHKLTDIEVEYSTVQLQSDAWKSSF